MYDLFFSPAAERPVKNSGRNHSKMPIELPFSRS